MNRMPTLFVSHGAPTFAMEPGLAGPQLQALGRSLPRPRAVLVVSPHWMSRGVRVGLSEQPATIHDFGGFPQPLYEIQYPAAGHAELAQQTLQLLHDAGWPVVGDEARGLDHGAWVPLLYLYPDADVPVFQVSLPAGLDEAGAFRFGQALAPLREQGVLIVGSGSLTHNLYEVRAGQSEGEAYATEFAAWVRQVVGAGDSTRLQATMAQAPHARRAHPTTEHLLPLMVAAGAAGVGVTGSLIDGGITYGVLAMDAFLFAPAASA
ncbi:MAG: dioxygenase [Hydrogenophaga sp.]|uniref:dioxygenase family protein n=1 Tax=Hydrogenophaga sp. TaxID=1904254 RepID=UPI001DF7B8BC|nr:class III extradiol ring-cleavage dioxygenase [Hydrogenophaga sp.]MBX3611082.1 dioxygenase [Hydrogenophaga sp.]